MNASPPQLTLPAQFHPRVRQCSSARPAPRGSDSSGQGQNLGSWAGCPHGGVAEEEGGAQSSGRRKELLEEMVQQGIQGLWERGWHLRSWGEHLCKGQGEGRNRKTRETTGNSQNEVCVCVCVCLTYIHSPTPCVCVCVCVSLTYIHFPTIHGKGQKQQHSWCPHTDL